MRKKSTIFALVAVLCIAAALYFMQRETKEMYSDGDDLLIDEEPDTEPEAEPKPRRARKEQVKQPTDESTEQPTAAEGDTNE